MYFAFLPLLYLLTVFGGLAVSIRYRHLATHIPLIIAGFVVESLTHVIPGLMGLMPALVSFLHLPSGVLGGLPQASFWYSILPMFSVGGWAMVVGGLCLALREFDQKLTVRDIDRSITLLNAAPQRNAADAYHESPAYHSQPVHSQAAQFPSAQEEIHATAFASPAAPSSALSPSSLPMGGTPVQPVRVVAVEQPEHAVTLGSATQ